MILNSGVTTRLAALIKSGEIDDRTLINIYDREGKFLLRGAWYEDKVLEYSERFGKATKRLSGFYACPRVIFQLI